MKHRLRLLSAFLFLVLAVVCQFETAEASTISYSWSGQLVPNGSDDPWSIGSVGKPFKLEVAISRNAIDLFDLNVEFAAFHASQVRLLLDENEVHYLGNGNLDFTDNSSGLQDIIVFTGNFEVSGSAIEIGSAVALPDQTYQFSQSIEQPPAFQSTNDTIGGTCCGGIYASVIGPGTQIYVVPEFTTVGLMLVSACLPLTLLPLCRQRT